MAGKRKRAPGLPNVVAALVVIVLVVAGCAPFRGAGDDPTGDEAGRSPSDWTCVPEDALAAERIAGRTQSWTADGGSMFSAHETRGRETATPGRATRGEAIADAVSSAAGAALDLLANRGVLYDTDRRGVIVRDVTRAVVRGSEVEFPRMQVVARSWEECVAGAAGTEAGADTTWRAAVLVEYPIGLLRGDVRNVLWERERAANEAEVLMASAEEHLSAGRWQSGQLDAARAADLVRATGAPLDGGPSPVATDASGEPGSERPAVGARLKELFARSRAAASGALPVVAEPVGGVDVIESGAAVDVTVQFRCTYEWEGREVRAKGVPVRFEVPDASAVLNAWPVTDERGIATCGILAAHGPPGEYELKVYLDADAARAALELGDASGGEPAPLARQPIHVVAGSHSVSVCATFGEAGDADAAQVAAGFAKRMERDGFTMGDCGPNVGVVVTGTVVLGTSGGPGSWKAEVALTGSAFDQRTVRELGEVTVRATQVADPESGDGGRRAAEVLALKEAGRLLAVYFGPRILSSEK